MQRVAQLSALLQIEYSIDTELSILVVVIIDGLVKSQKFTAENAETTHYNF